MTWRIVILALVLGFGLSGPGRAAAPESYDGGRMGTLGLWAPTGQPDGIVFLFSDAAGWTADSDAAAKAVADLGSLVVGVDLSAYLGQLAASTDGCHYVVAEIEDLSHRLERKYGFADYHSPVLAGDGAGATMAYAALAQAPAATVEGAASLEPAPSLGTKVPLCAGAAATPAAGGGYSYSPRTGLPGWWRAGAAAPDPALAAFAQAAGGEVVPVPADGSLADRLVAVLRPELSAAADAVANLPLVELRATQPSPLLAIVYSGDGGWRDLDKTIGEALQASGVSVVGVDSLRYFWSAKTPDETAHDLASIIDHYTAAWGAGRVVLIGYSFGANVLPFAYNRLPQADRDRVVEVSLLGLAERSEFEIRVTGWLGVAASEDSPAVLPELQRMDLHRVQCFYGADEDDTACTEPALKAAQIIETKGGHHFDGDYARLAQLILQGAAQPPT